MKDWDHIAMDDFVNGNISEIDKSLVAKKNMQQRTTYQTTVGVQNVRVEHQRKHIGNALKPETQIP